MTLLYPLARSDGGDANSAEYGLTMNSSEAMVNIGIAREIR